jgi:hypothetical protein
MFLTMAADPTTEEKIRLLLGVTGDMTWEELRAFRFHIAAQIAGTGVVDQHGFVVAAAAARRDVAGLKTRE